ncbi:nitroreductase family protein [Massiliimalia timonensis]|uniref:nitroreductase family protein n=1 Tax=Massiliimalia timonensis TaxID=1987501 RepID=UPI00189E395B|nr:nitroreductase family protein [Massiliimalia timonensis]
MELLDLMRKRQSCRDFSDRPVRKEELFQCVEAARIAPSGQNHQPWKFVIVHRKDLCRQVAKIAQQYGDFNRFCEPCPAFVVVQKRYLPGDRDIELDLGLCVMQLCLEAEALGLSTCMIGAFGAEQLSDLLGLSPQEPPRLLVAVGYAADETHREKTRLPYEEVVTYLGEES